MTKVYFWDRNCEDNSFFFLRDYFRTKPKKTWYASLLVIKKGFFYILGLERELMFISIIKHFLIMDALCSSKRKDIFNMYLIVSFI